MHTLRPIVVVSALVATGQEEEVEKWLKPLELLEVGGTPGNFDKTRPPTTGTLRVPPSARREERWFC
jgi:hypothetical protein